MSYRANLIRASNAPSPPRYSRRSARPSPPPPRPPRPPPPPLQLLTTPAPPGCIYYGVKQNRYAQASITNGMVIGYRAKRVSAETLSTLQKSQRRARKRSDNNIGPSIYFDKDSNGFEWLIGGWLAEKRISSADVKAYQWLYYDPLGQQYRSKRKALRAMLEQNDEEESNEQGN